eukprot:gene157-32968_t
MSAAPVTFKKKKRKGTTRVRAKPTLDEDAPDEEATEGKSVSEVLAETKEAQLFRNRIKGVSAIGLATGERISANEEAELDANGWSLAKGGVMPRVAVVKDRDRDRDGEDNSTTKDLSKKFGVTQDIDWEDAQMQKYVEEQIRLRDGQEIVKVDNRSEYEKQAQALYQVPQEMRDLQDSEWDLKRPEQGILSNAILSGIPEVDLGVDAKMANIEDTEAARLDYMRNRRGKKAPAPGQLISQATKKRSKGDAALNFGRARFLSGGRHDHNARGTSIGVVAGRDTELTDHMQVFEEAKKQGFESGVLETASFTKDPANLLRNMGGRGYGGRGNGGRGGGRGRGYGGEPVLVRIALLLTGLPAQESGGLLERNPSTINVAYNEAPPVYTTCMAAYCLFGNRIDALRAVELSNAGNSSNHAILVTNTIDNQRVTRRNYNSGSGSGSGFFFGSGFGDFTVDCRNPPTPILSAITCNGRGTVQSDGSCECTPGTSECQCQCTDSPLGDGTCYKCAAGYSGAVCEYSRRDTCGGHGEPAATGGRCTSCDAGYAGSNCEFSSANTCGGHGIPVDGGRCTSCDAGYAGSNCEFSSANTCGGHGIPVDGGSCSTCDAGYAGPNCQFTDATTCNGKGTALASGTCTDCRAGYAGPQCQYSDGFDDDSMCTACATNVADGPSGQCTTCIFYKFADSFPSCEVPVCTTKGTYVGGANPCSCDFQWSGARCECFEDGGACVFCAPDYSGGFTYELRASGQCETAGPAESNAPEAPTAESTTSTTVTTRTTSMDIRLAGGSATRGRLELVYNGQWSTVCDDGFDSSDGAVACRQLGLGSYVGTYDASGGTGSILYDDMACSGSESSLYDCSKRQGGSNCDHDEDIGLECRSGRRERAADDWHLAPVGSNACDSGQPAPQESCEAIVASMSLTSTGQLPGRSLQTGSGGSCSDGGCPSSHPYLEEYINSGVPSGSFWCYGSPNNGGGTPCNMHTSGISPPEGYLWGENQPACQLDDLGWGAVPLGCSAQTGGDWAAHFKSSGNEASNCFVGGYQMVCSGPSAGSNADETTNTECSLVKSAASADRTQDGDADGTQTFDDILADLLAGLDGEGGGDAAADAAAAAARAAAAAAAANADANLVALVEAQLETQIATLRAADEQARLVAATEIRLAGGSSSSGRLEVNYNGQWSTVCDDSFDTADGLVACRQLGYAALGVIGDASGGEGDILFDDMRCAGSEDRFLDCAGRQGGSNCGHSEDVSLTCS